MKNVVKCEYISIRFSLKCNTNFNMCTPTLHIYLFFNNETSVNFLSNYCGLLTKSFELIEMRIDGNYGISLWNHGAM